MKRQLNIIISGGGTGGHVFPAISIAQALKEKRPGANILFVGARGRMEMKKVPEAGFPIEGLPVSGFVRKLSLKNIKVLINLFKSLRLAKRIIKEFRPDVVVGVGGYASGPVLRKASQQGIPTLIQEQNSYAGITNKLLAAKAKKICVAYEGMEKYFPADKILLTGNPVRKDFFSLQADKEEALQYFGFPDGEKVVLVLGGSLGARSINEALLKDHGKLLEQGIDIIWQTGKYYYQGVKEKVEDNKIYITDFIQRMDYAYALAKVIVSRAGAGTISELCIVGKPVILVPSPNVAEDHQTRNAESLEKIDAGLKVADQQAKETLIPRVLELIQNPGKKEELSTNIKKMARPNAAGEIAGEILKLVE